MNRHERRKAAKEGPALIVPVSAKTRVLAFLDAFHKASNDADIEIRGGFDATGKPAVLVTIIGSGDHALMVDEARTVAKIMEEAMNAHPEDPEGATLPNIIMALRHGCNAAESAVR